jgi:DNA-binding XRE family transcriptional regulator
MSTEKMKNAMDYFDSKRGPLTFGEFVIGMRTTKDMNQAQMARFLGMSRSALCDIEKGRQSVSLALAAKIARKCRVSEAVAVQTALADQLRRAKLKLKVEVSAA